MDRWLLNEFLYRLYGMYLAVLTARMAASQGDQSGHGDSLFPDEPRPRPRNPYPWDDFVGRPPAGGNNPPPTTAPAGGPAILAVAPGLHPRLGSVGPGASLDAGAGGGFLC